MLKALGIPNFLKWLIIKQPGYINLLTATTGRTHPASSALDEGMSGARSCGITRHLQVSLHGQHTTMQPMLTKVLVAISWAILLMQPFQPIILCLIMWDAQLNSAMLLVPPLLLILQVHTGVPSKTSFLRSWHWSHAAREKIYVVKLLSLNLQLYK